MTYEEKLEAFRAQVTEDLLARMRNEYPDYPENCLPHAVIKPGKVWDKVDRVDGNGTAGSGMYMVLRDPSACKLPRAKDLPQGAIFTIKAYGVPNRFILIRGPLVPVTLDNAHQMFWGGYGPEAKRPA